MPVTYSEVEDTSEKLLGQILKSKVDGTLPHKNLIESKARIDMEFAIGEDGSPAVKVGGYTTFGRVKVFSPEDRKLGAPDARIIVDKFVWEKASVDQRKGMLDHLLHQLDVRTVVKSGEFITDAVGRPKLKRRKFDLRLSGFSEVIKRNGESSPEYAAVQEMREKYGQLLLPWSEPKKLSA